MMKKNHAARLGALALALTLVSTCLMGGTLAKYTTTVEASAKATVAKWDFGKTTVTDLGDLFIHGNSGVITPAKNAPGILAPGTEGEKNFTIVGVSDVTYDLTVTAECSYTGKWECDDKNAKYYPIMFQLTTGDGSVNDGEWVNLEGLKDKLDGLSEKGVTPHSEKTTSYTIHWKWEFTSTDADSKDTYLGNIAATAAENDKPNVEIKLAITATQVQPAKTVTTNA